MTTLLGLVLVWGGSDMPELSECFPATFLPTSNGAFAAAR